MPGSPPPHSAGDHHHQRLGRRGEARAADWYRRRGYEVVDRNWRCREGELDLVLRRRDELVFCEVKARTSRRFGHPVEAVTAAKRERIRGLALRWLSSHRLPARAIRFDIAAVEGRWVEVWKGVF